MRVCYSKVGCRACGCPATHKHRIIPGAWGGEYTADNVIRLCPTCHAGMHVLTDWVAKQHRGQWLADGRVGRGLCRLVTYFRSQPKLWELFCSEVWPRVNAHLATKPTGGLR